LKKDCQFDGPELEMGLGARHGEGPDVKIPTCPNLKKPESSAGFSFPWIKNIVNSDHYILSPRDRQGGMLFAFP
jgi:hypothetical protein